jgi:hypothetical protein
MTTTSSSADSGVPCTSGTLLGRSALAPGLGLGRLADLGVVVPAVVGALDLGDLGPPGERAAALSATMSASVPEFTKRSFSKCGLRAHRCSAYSTSASVAIMNAVPRATCSLTASTISGWACPWISEHMLLEKSMRDTPSMSMRRQPSPWSA